MDSNRLRVAIVRETTLGTLPGSARMRTARITQESLRYTPSFFQSAELRADRMNAAPSKQNESAGGGLNSEFSFPYDETYFSEMLRSLFYSTWTRTPQHFNDGTADSVITDYQSGTGVFTVVDQSGADGFAGTAYKVGHLVQAQGFAAANNNRIARVSSSTSTSVTVATGGTNDTAPAAAARLKVVGFRGASGDVTATASGLGSTVLDFTTLGLAVGQWLKIGGSAAGEQFATAADNGWARITAIAATALTLDNLPTGWATDSGTGKTISVWFGDIIRNGTTRTSMSIEKTDQSQTTPTRIIHKGMVVNSGAFSVQTDQAVTVQFDLVGLTGGQQTSDYGTSYDAATTEAVLTGNVSVGDVREAGTTIGTPNWSRQIDFTIMNSVRAINALANVGAVDLGVGDCMVTGTLTTYFGSNAYLAKLLAGTVTNLSARQQTTKTAGTSGRAMVESFPQVTFTGGSPNAGGKSQDITLPLQFTASIDTLTNCQVQFDRFEYMEL